MNKQEQEINMNNYIKYVATIDNITIEEVTQKLAPDFDPDIDYGKIKQENLFNNIKLIQNNINDICDNEIELLRNCTGIHDLFGYCNCFEFSFSEFSIFMKKLLDKVKLKYKKEKNYDENYELTKDDYENIQDIPIINRFNTMDDKNAKLNYFTFHNVLYYGNSEIESSIAWTFSTPQVDVILEEFKYVM